MLDNHLVEIQSVVFFHLRFGTSSPPSIQSALKLNYGINKTKHFWKIIYDDYFSK